MAAKPGFVWNSVRQPANVNTLTVPEPTVAILFTDAQLPTADRHLMVGDDVYVLLSVEAARSTSMPAGWTRTTSVTGLYFSWKAEVWHYGVSATSTWSDLAATVTLGTSPNAPYGSTVTASAIGLLVRGTYIDPVSTTTFTPSSSPAGPSVTYTGTNAYSFGWVIGANYSTANYQTPQISPSTGDDNGPQNGWTGISTIGSNQEPGHKILLNSSDAPPAPTFFTSGAVKYAFVWFSIRKTPTGGWSVGQMKY